MYPPIKVPYFPFQYPTTALRTVRENTVLVPYFPSWGNTVYKYKDFRTACQEKCIIVYNMSGSF